LAALVLSLQCEILGAIGGAPDRLSDDAVRTLIDAGQIAMAECMVDREASKY
jgi:hypothetical protein